jgi:hypothetical protein
MENPRKWRGWCRDDKKSLPALWRKGMPVFVPDMSRRTKALVADEKH